MKNKLSHLFLITLALQIVVLVLAFILQFNLKSFNNSTTTLIAFYVPIMVVHIGISYASFLIFKAMRTMSFNAPVTPFIVSSSISVVSSVSLALFIVFNITQMDLFDIVVIYTNWIFIAFAFFNIAFLTYSMWTLLKTKESFLI